jgi:hypothetical protein
MDPAIFIIDLQDASKKLIFKHNSFCLLLFEGTFTSYFKYEKSKRVTTIEGIKVFQLFLRDGRIRIQIRIHTSD